MAKSNNTTDTLETLDLQQLSDVNGGVPTWLANTAKFAGKAAGKLALPVTVGMAAYDAYEGYRNGRARGESVLKSVGSGALNAGTMGISEMVRN